MQIQITTIDNGYIIAVPPSKQGEAGKVFYVETPQEIADFLNSLNKPTIKIVI